MLPNESRNIHYVLLAGIVLLGVALRAAFFFGYGVTADDSIYAGMSNQLAQHGWKALDFRLGVNYRVGLSVPVALLFRAFGINDISFVVYPFLCSIASIGLAFLLGRRLLGSAAGLTAAFLLATCPFDVVFASSMTIDVITSCLTAAAVLAFLAARDASHGRVLVWGVFGATAILMAYMVKEPALYVLPCLGAMTLARVRDLRVVHRDAACFALTGLLLAATVAVDWFVMGDALNRFHVQLPQSGVASGPIRDTLLEYPRWLWLQGPEGAMLFGYLFYALVPALLYGLIRRIPGTSVPLLWLLGMAALLEFLPKQLDPVLLSPRYPRYAHALLVPAVLLIAAALEDVRGRLPSVSWVVLVLLGTSGVIEATLLHRAWSAPVIDRNEASRFLVSLPPKPVYSDFWLTTRYQFDMQYAPAMHTPWDVSGKPLQIDVIEKNDLETLWTIPEGYVVTGGSRGIEVGLYTVLNLHGHTPPPTWTLLKRIVRPSGPKRLEPLRIWEVRPPGAAPPGRHGTSRQGHSRLPERAGSGYEESVGSEDAS